VERDKNRTIYTTSTDDEGKDIELSKIREESDSSQFTDTDASKGRTPVMRLVKSS
jgi:hypothetical protein